MCQSVVTPDIPLIGVVSLTLKAGGGGKPVEADNLYIDLDQLDADACSRTSTSVWPPRTPTKGPGIKSGDAGATRTASPSRPTRPPDRREADGVGHHRRHLQAQRPEDVAVDGCQGVLLSTRLTGGGAGGAPPVRSDARVFTGSTTHSPQKRRTRELFSMSAETTGRIGQFTRPEALPRLAGHRPFWAGLFDLLAGVPIAYFPYANLKLGHLTLAMATTAGAGSLIIGVLLVVLGLTMWFQKHVRVFAGVAAILLGLVSIPVSNLGGFLIGFLLALVGGAMAVSWAPGAPPAGRGPEGDAGRPRARTPRAPRRRATSA